jgi:transcriptional regulator with XRE-family HTH domain
MPGWIVSHRGGGRENEGAGESRNLLVPGKVEANTVERWGVQQSEITISYRFSQLDEPAALVLPRSHRLNNRNQPPKELNTLGDHLLRRRLVLKLLQREVAEQIGVDKASIANWEGNRSKPGLKYMPAIFRFLGYNPLQPGEGWAERLVQCRTMLGISQKEAAGRIGVDQSTLARWERGEREPTGKFEVQVLQFLSAVATMAEPTPGSLKGYRVSANPGPLTATP